MFQSLFLFYAAWFVKMEVYALTLHLESFLSEDLGILFRKINHDVCLASFVILKKKHIWNKSVYIFYHWFFWDKRIQLAANLCLKIHISFMTTFETTPTSVFLEIGIGGSGKYFKWVLAFFTLQRKMFGKYSSRKVWHYCF